MFPPLGPRFMGSFGRLFRPSGCELQWFTGMVLSGTPLWTRSGGWNVAARRYYPVAVGFTNSKVFPMSTPVYQPFPDTHWSLVRRAGFSDGTARHEALATLLARYQPALLSYLMRVWQL